VAIIGLKRRKKMGLMLDKLNKQKKELDEALQKTARDAYVEVFNEFFEKYPQVEKISWTQATPYFNDGDPCVFSVHECCINGINSYGDGDYQEEDEEVEEAFAEKSKEEQDEHEKICNEFDKIIYENEQAAEIAFGDHSRIVVTRDNIEVDEYYHD